MSVEEAIHPASPYELGGISWDPAPYVGLPTLAPFTDLVNEHCKGLSPFYRVTCLSNVLAAKFDHAKPSKDAFDDNFDPVNDLQRHLSGEGGHCVTRSSIIATALLATGTPARLVQVHWVQANGIKAGHNVVEYFDGAQGWTLFDPSYGGGFEAPNGERAASASILQGKDMAWHQEGNVPASVTRDPEGPGWRPTISGVLSIIYVEPWLHIRQGHRVAPRPFNGAFVLAGPHATSMVWSHWLLRGLIVTTGLSCAVASLLWARSTRRRPRTITAPNDNEAVTADAAMTG